jgi:hypothetical protein
MRLLLSIFFLLIFTQCSKDVYRYGDEEYRWYDLETALRKTDKVVALDLSSLDLEHIPTEVQQFSNLRFLNLGGNNLKELPEFIYRSNSIEALLLFNNSNLIISPQISRMDSLKILNIGKCGLDEFPEAIYELKNLELLGVSGNNFSLEQLKKISTGMAACRVIISLD